MLESKVSLANKQKYTINDLVNVMTFLRDPDDGCPWDLEQDLQSLRRFTLEEAYEVCEAIDRKDMDELKEELGDLLLQIIFQSQIACEEGAFEFSDVVHTICEKMVRRHPHVFANGTAATADEVVKNWEAIKGIEKSAKRTSAMDDIPNAFPALIRSKKIYKRAASVGFVWNDSEGAFAKVKEEIEELN